MTRKDQEMKADISSKSDLPLPENPNKTKEKMGQREKGFWDLAGLVQKAQTGQSKKKKQKKKMGQEAGSRPNKQKKKKKNWNRSGAQPIRILPSEPESTFVNLRGSSEGETPPLNLRGSGDRKIQTESPRFKLRSTQVTPSQVTKDPQPRRSSSGSSPLTPRPSTSAATTGSVAATVQDGSTRAGDIEDRDP
jgi:hypothetical protein